MKTYCACLQQRCRLGYRQHRHTASVLCGSRPLQEQPTVADAAATGAASKARRATRAFPQAQGRPGVPEGARRSGPHRRRRVRAERHVAGPLTCPSPLPRLSPTTSKDARPCQRLHRYPLTPVYGDSVPVGQNVPCRTTPRSRWSTPRSPSRPWRSPAGYRRIPGRARHGRLAAVPARALPRRGRRARADGRGLTWFQRSRCGRWVRLDLPGPNGQDINALQINTSPQLAVLVSKSWLSSSQCLTRFSHSLFLTE